MSTEGEVMKNEEEVRKDEDEEVITAPDEGNDQDKGAEVITALDDGNNEVEETENISTLNDGKDELETAEDISMLDDEKNEVEEAEVISMRDDEKNEEEGTEVISMLDDEKTEEEETDVISMLDDDKNKEDGTEVISMLDDGKNEEEGAEVNDEKIEEEETEVNDEKIEEEETEVNDEKNRKDETEVITMVDVLESQTAIEEDARAVLGGSDDKNCTYDRGYVGRQALYACLTCCPKEGERRAAVCLACSLACHDHHDLVELYTKRAFRCDCGGPASSSCVFSPTPRPPNARNRYNQNFEGLYCNCRRPYPDPQNPSDVDMIQCIACEDWLHADHLGVDSVPKNDSYAEMICGPCTDARPFLDAYAANPDESLDAVSSPKRARLDDSSECTKPAVAAGRVAPGPATFWPSEWRSTLCRCRACLDEYAATDSSYLLDAEDTVTAYESLPRRTLDSQYDRGMEALSSLDRVSQLDAITEYNNMKEKLLEFLRTFRDRREVVREEDIKGFFAQMKPEKKPGGVYFCR